MEIFAYKKRRQMFRLESNFCTKKIYIFSVHVNLPNLSTHHRVYHILKNQSVVGIRTRLPTNSLSWLLDLAWWAVETGLFRTPHPDPSISQPENEWKMVKKPLHTQVWWGQEPTNINQRSRHLCLCPKPDPAQPLAVPHLPHDGWRNRGQKRCGWHSPSAGWQWAWTSSCHTRAVTTGWTPAIGRIGQK